MGRIALLKLEMAQGCGRVLVKLSALDDNGESNYSAPLTFTMEENLKGKEIMLSAEEWPHLT